MSSAKSVICVPALRPVLPLEVELGRPERRDEFVEALTVGTLEVVNSLFGISERDDPAAPAQLFDHRPFLGIGILELIDNDQRIGAAIGLSEHRYPREQFGQQRRKEVEGDQPLLVKELPLPGEARGAVQTGQAATGLRRKKQRHPLTRAKKIRVSSEHRPGEAVVGVDLNPTDVLARQRNDRLFRDARHRRPRKAQTGPCHPNQARLRRGRRWPSPVKSSFSRPGTAANEDVSPGRQQPPSIITKHQRHGAYSKRFAGSADGAGDGGVTICFNAAIMRHHRRREMSHLALFEKDREIVVTLLVHEQLVERLATGVVGGASSRNKMLRRACGHSPAATNHLTNQVCMAGAISARRRFSNPA